MKNFLKVAVTVSGLMISAGCGVAADWSPSGPIEMLIAFRAGGGADTQARFIAEELEARHGWKVVPKQVTGRGGINALLDLKDTPRDGTAIAMVVTETLGYNAAAHKDLGISSADFTGLTTTAAFQMGIVAKTSSGFQTFADVIAAAKAGEAIKFGVMSRRLGDLAYLIAQKNGVKFNIVTVQGGDGVMDNMNTGNLDVAFMAGIQSEGVASGDLVNLASGMSAPLVQSPDAPMLDAFGVQYVADLQIVFVGPLGMDAAAAKALTDAIAEIVNDPKTKAGGLVQKAFGGPTTIMGADLDAALARRYDDAIALISDLAK